MSGATLRSGLRGRWIGRAAAASAIWLIVIVAAVIGQLLSPYFLTWVNITNLLSQSSVLGIAAVGMTFVMVAREIDVSVAGIATLSAVFGAAVMDGQDARVPLAILVAIAVGVAVGLFNGFLVARGVQSFILTLVVGIVLLAIGKLYTGGAPIGNVAPGYNELFTSRWLDIPVPAYVLLATVVVAYLIQRFTRLGRRVFLVGSNRRAAYFSGVNVRGTILGSYVLSGITAGLAGLVLLGRTGVPNDFSGMGLEFQALAAVVIGGTAFAGGRGSVVGTLAGALLLSISITLGVILGLPYGAQLVEYGVLIVVASIAYSLLRPETRS
jgi:ribose/xylose/arabinose/galactoside ABC-type transport system permease subunit